ncbi:MAG: uracil-DNA glycosylase [Boseongicola sp.]|nr:uracil-DNA glycosylase [Boseongicola sp.]
MPPIHTLPGAWSHLPFFTDHWPTIETALANETRRILPPNTQRFAALDHTSPQNTRVVILGQDPYPTAGHANGLAFSVAPEVALPRSLKNIYREMEDDLGAHPATGDLTHWANQGVLLLNTALSVPEGTAGAHAKLGWSHLTRDVLAEVSKNDCAFLLWGNHAQSFREVIHPGTGLVIETAHPSPLSARRGFFGSRPFSRVNAWFQTRGEAPIDWIGAP